MSLDQFIDKKELKIIEQQTEIYRLENEIRTQKFRNDVLKQLLDWEYFERDLYEENKKLESKCLEYYNKLTEILDIVKGKEKNKDKFSKIKNIIDEHM